MAQNFYSNNAKTRTEAAAELGVDLEKLKADTKISGKKASSGNNLSITIETTPSRSSNVNGTSNVGAVSTFYLSGDIDHVDPNKNETTKKNLLSSKAWEGDVKELMNDIAALLGLKKKNQSTR
jgi:hypothetical protein